MRERLILSLLRLLVKGNIGKSKIVRRILELLMLRILRISC